MTGNELMNCRQTDILTCETEGLVDLQQVRIQTTLPLPQRAEQYLDQVHNPYLFRVDKLIVKVSFGGNQDLATKLAGLMAQ